METAFGLRQRSKNSGRCEDEVNAEGNGKDKSDVKGERKGRDWDGKRARVDPGRGSHTTARELQTCTFQGPGASNTTKIQREDTQRDTMRAKRWRETKKKKRKILGLPPFRAPPFRVRDPTLRGPTLNVLSLPLLPEL